MSKTVVVAISSLFFCIGLVIGISLTTSEMDKLKGEISNLEAHNHSLNDRITNLHSQIENLDQKNLKIKNTIEQQKWSNDDTSVNQTTSNNTEPESKQTSQDSTIIVEFSGSGGKSTRPFTVPSGWEIQWDSQGSIFQIFLYKEDGSIVGVAANQQGAGKGTSYQPKAGKYYLKVNTLDKWKIRIINVAQ
jgi:FtsZ-binding cell division protein ZapB